MSIFALQSIAGGFLDEDLQHFNKKFDDWCIQFENYEDAFLADGWREINGTEYYFENYAYGFNKK